MSIRSRHADRFTIIPAAVFLDLDNTLYPYDPPHSAAMKIVSAKACRMLSVSHEQFRDVYFEARNQVKAALHHTAASHNRLLYFQRTIELLGLKSQILLALDFEQTYWRAFMTEVKLFDGVKEFLDDLRLYGIPTCLVTDLTAQVQFRKLVHLGLDHYLDYVVTSEEAGIEKPHKTPFHLAQQKIGQIEGPIWMIGDCPYKDIKGSRETINAVTLQKYHQGVITLNNSDGADLIFDDFAELRKFLENFSIVA